MDQLLREFLAEAEDLIETLFRDIQTLREKHREGRARRELTARIFRHVHTLKGTAAAAGLDVASQIAHEFETLLDALRAGRAELDEAALDALEDAAHALSEALDAATRGETSPLPLQLVETLQRLARVGDDQPPSHHDSAAMAALLPEEIACYLGADDARRLHETLAEGQRLFLVGVTFELEIFDQRFRELSAALDQVGELVSTLPGASEAPPDAISFRLLYATALGAEEIIALTSPSGSVSVEELKLEATGQSERDAHTLDEESTPESVSAEKAQPPSTQVRVELGKLDELISAAHELLTETAAVLNLALAGDAARGERGPLEERAARIHQRFVELEEQLIGLRRVPLGQTLERAARAGRQAARSTNKEAAFEIVGGEVRLDKSLVEAISDPLLHLVRNAVDHGLETAEERRAAGKSECGAVRLEVRAEGDRVIFRIADDGRGIDLEKIARAALERGIIEAGRSVSRHQALRLIFRPGFSTAVAVSKMSGRGVGLDVVERAVEQLGGEMRVRSETGRGTTFEMIVPVALALFSALVVSSDGFPYCVDERWIEATGLVAAEDVGGTNGREFINWRGASLRLVRLRQLLGQPTVAEESAPSLPVIILSQAAKGSEKEPGGGEASRVAVLVDALEEGRAEVLVRRLGAHAWRWPGVSGAAELSDGRLALVLDLPRLVETSGEAR